MADGRHLENYYDVIQDHLQRIMKFDKPMRNNMSMIVKRSKWKSEVRFSVWWPFVFGNRK